jgi:restriction endonuclease
VQNLYTTTLARSTDMHMLLHCCCYALISQKTAIKESVKLDSAAAALEFENRLLKDKLNDLTRYNHSLVRHAFLNQENMVAAVIRGDAARAHIVQLSAQKIINQQSNWELSAQLVSTTDICFLYTRITV